ncbi:hypothetical protein CSE45_1465 [Citreicella sp. SE45]|nr:hypothetical protein CSE45_1465 [Citreicella sp. SE45]
MRNVSGLTHGKTGRGQCPPPANHPGDHLPTPRRNPPEDAERQPDTRKHLRRTHRPGPWVRAFRLVTCAGETGGQRGGTGRSLDGAGSVQRPCPRRPGASGRGAGSATTSGGSAVQPGEFREPGVPVVAATGGDALAKFDHATNGDDDDHCTNIHFQVLQILQSALRGGLRQIDESGVCNGSSVPIADPLAEMMAELRQPRLTSSSLLLGPICPAAAPEGIGPRDGEATPRGRLLPLRIGMRSARGDVVALARVGSGVASALAGVL